MTRDEATALAREWLLQPHPENEDVLTSLTTLILSAVEGEREACAELSQDMVLYTGLDVADAIRARGERGALADLDGTG